MHWFRQLAEMYSERDIPLYHAEVYADIRVKLSAQGEYLGAEAARRKVVIPITEQSASRTSAVQPHPLCDILGYLAVCGASVLVAVF